MAALYQGHPIRAALGYRLMGAARVPFDRGARLRLRQDCQGSKG